MKYLITFILWVFFVPVAEATPAPDWVLGKGHPKYSEIEYIVGVGHSDKSTVSANESARAELVKSIRVKVNSLMKDYTSDTLSIAEATIKSETEFLLEGSQVKDGWYDDEKDMFYSLIVIKRSYVADTLMEMIGMLVSNNDSTLRQADTFFNEGKILKALVYYYDGYIESNKIVPYIQTYNSVILNNNKMALGTDYNLLFREKIQSIVDNIRIEPLKKMVKDDVVHFSVQVFYKNDPIEFPIKFYSVYKHYADRIFCQTKGCYLKIDVLDVINDKFSFGLISAVDTQTLKKYFTYELEPKLFKRLEFIKVQFKRDLEPINNNTIYDDMQIEQERKDKVFKQMDRAVRRSRYGTIIRPDIDLRPMNRGRWNWNIRIFGGF